jgi:pimeloyl-ACP methyl ester carboxylesterase
MLAAIAVPALVLTGESDSLVGSPADLAARIPGATSRTVPGEHPDAMRSPAFAAAVVEFLTHAPRGCADRRSRGPSGPLRSSKSGKR